MNATLYLFYATRFGVVLLAAGFLTVVLSMVLVYRFSRRVDRALEVAENAVAMMEEWVVSNDTEEEEGMGTEGTWTP